MLLTSNYALKQALKTLNDSTGDGQYTLMFYRRATGSYTMKDNFAPPGWYLTHTRWAPEKIPGGAQYDQRRGCFVGYNAAQALQDIHKRL